MELFAQLQTKILAHRRERQQNTRQQNYHRRNFPKIFWTPGKNRVL